MGLEEHLLRDEADRLQVYDDATGKTLKRGTKLIGVPTIGVGINLLVGITREESRYLLRNRITDLQYVLRSVLPWYVSLSPVRRVVIENMAYNLGLTGLMKFKATLAAIKAGEYHKAAEQMLRSRWATQVGKRAHRLATMMREDREL
jgi:lysozyme